MNQRFANITFRLKDVPPDPNAVPGRYGRNEVSLTLDRAWAISAGVKPDINSAVVPYSEFDKLWIATPPAQPNDPKKKPTETEQPPPPGYPEPDPPPTPEPAPATSPTPLYTRGDICFYYTSDAAPDHVIEDVTIVDAEVIEWGQIKVNTPEASDPIRAPIGWRIWFADFRHRAGPNRTGRLTDGLINPSASKEQPATPPALVPNKDLIDRCLAAMGQAFPTCPETVNKYPPKMDLEWYGAVPRDELDSLLAHAHHLFCPVSDIHEQIQELGDGDDPEVPVDQLIMEYEVPLLRPGKTVIVTSAPTPVIETYRSGGTPDQPNWDFVLQDSDGQWKRLSHLSVFATAYNGDPVAGMRDFFRQIPEPTRHDLFNGAYSFLQLDPARFPPDQCPLVRKRIDKAPNPDPGQPLYEYNDVVITATIALPLYGDGGGWRNTNQPIQTPVNWIGGPNIIYCQTRLGRFTDNNVHPAPEPEFWPADDIRVEFSVESWDKDRKRKKYFIAGYRQEVGEIKELSDSEAQALFDSGGKDTDELIIHHAPELQYVMPNGIDDSGLKKKLRDAAKVIAQTLLAEISVKPTESLAAGFVPCQISGKVHRIEYDQNAVTTRIFTSLHNRVGVAEEGRSRAGPGGAYPGDRSTQQPRTFLGQSGETQPAVPVSPQQSRDTAQMIEFRITSAAPGDREYYGRSVAPDGTIAAADDVIALNHWDVPNGTKSLTEAPVQNTTFIGLVRGRKDGKTYVRFCGIDLGPCGSS